MFHTPDYYHNISMRLSEVLDNIGVSENMVMKWRKATLLAETIQTFTPRARGRKRTVFMLGSRSEGTTTSGLKSDSDMLVCMDDNNVIQDWYEWTPGKLNLLIIQNERTPPGYCLLQVLRSDAPLPACTTHEMDNFFVNDTSGRILCKNSILDAVITEGYQRQGPSAATAEQPGFTSSDNVLALPCNSWPHLRAWLDHHETNTWPTAEIKKYAKSTKRFVVGVGSKAGESGDFEWRLSTSLAERCLMFNLNITQIRCYILMKMILKTYINLDNESYISSYMCKTVLFHCISSKHSNIWKDCNILNCLNFCIFTLNRCILCGNCPHFIINENNLMAGKLSAEVKHQLVERMSNLIPCDWIALSGIQIDNLGERLLIKLNIINEVRHYIPHPDESTLGITSILLLGTASGISYGHNFLIHKLKDESLEMKLKTLQEIILCLAKYYSDGDMLEKTTCRLLAPLYCTSIGSLIASHNIQINSTVSPQALAWFEAGQNSDVASSRLKLAYIMYVVGNSEIAALILYNTEERYKIEVNEPVCGCYQFDRSNIRRGFGQLSSRYEEVALKNIVAYCVRYFPSEIYCVPHELQYEMFRSTQEDLQHRGIYDFWMDCAVVDSLPYIYFLQYKTYGSLQRPREQQSALNKLVWVIETEHNLAHRETALNLLGQCMEQENRPVDALKFYALSLHHSARNNAAKIHVCMCLASIFS